MPYRINIIILLLFFSKLLLAQTYNVKSISGLEGLSQSTINDICVDDVGNIWLATDFGLNRYDGQTIQKYFWDNNDSSTLSHDFINAIYKDNDGNIWVSTDGGLCLYNRLNDNFTRNPLNLENTISNALFYENKTELWFYGGGRNFWVQNKATKKVQEKIIQSSIENFNTAVVNAMVEFDDRHLLLVLNNSRLALYCLESSVLKPFMFLEMSQFTAIEKVDSSFYVATYEEVFKISNKGLIEGTFTKQNPGIGENIFLNVKQNPVDGNVWIASDFSGVFIVDKEFNLVDRIEAGADANKILPENSIKNIEFVNSQMIVLGSVRCGAILLYNSGIHQFRYNNGHVSGPSDRSVLCFEEDSEGRLWIGTDGEGLNYFDREKRQFLTYKDPEVRIVTSIVDYSDELLLLGSYQQGLYFFNKKNKTFFDAQTNPLFKNINRKVRHKVFKDSQGNLWISDGSLAKVNIEKNSFERFDYATHSDFFQDIAAIYFSTHESDDGKLWFTTVGGIFAYDLNAEKMSDRLLISELNKSAGTTIYSLEECKKGNLYLGTEKGLYKYDKKKGTLTALINANDFNNKRFSALYFDNNEQLWAGTSENLLRISNINSSREVSIYHRLEVAGGVEYRHGAVIRSNDNNLYVGSNDGITSFIPEHVAVDGSETKVTVTSFKRIGTQKKSQTDSTIVVDVKDNYNCTLAYAPAVYEFKFNAFNIPLEKYTKYAYTLENYEDIWHTGTSNMATYTNLPAGEYIFKVRSTNRTGQWCPEATTIGIKILPPWYQTAWFWLIVFVVISTIVIGIWRESLVRLKLKHKIELQEAEQEQLKVTNLNKLQFFTNISHELKTPLTLIYSPLKQLLKKNISEPEFRNALPSLYRNVRRMMALIDQLLEFRKAEMSTLKMNVSKVDCIESCQDIIDYFQYYSKVEGIKLVLEAEEAFMQAELDKDKLTKIMFNLISNALKHSKLGDTVCVSVNWFEDKIKIRVKDNGPGISKESKEHIFERYYQEEKEVSGAGIGLALTKHLVELHKGTITVDSELGQGALFSVLFPVKYEGIIHSAVEDKQKLFERMDKFVSSPALVNLSAQKELKVLVVEDEWELRHFLKNELALKYSVITACNGKEGFSSAVKHVPDLIITDIMMPKMNGYELCEKIKNDIRISHIPVVLLTAKSQSEHQAEGLKVGADLYIPKPFDMELLHLQVATLIRNRQLLKSRFSTDPEIESEELTHNSLDKEFMDKAIKLVEENVENQNFKVSDFVQQMGMSRSLVYTKINAIAGKPVKDFILNIRLQKAGKLITSSNKPISEIAYECGFTDPSYFSTVFKRYYSQTPVSYRNNYFSESLTTHRRKD